MTQPSPIVIKPKAPHDATVIFLHGLGDTGAGWAEVGSMFAPGLPSAKFVFPTAPKRPISLNYGMTMTGWYDIKSLDGINQQEDAEGLRQSMRYIESLVQAEVDAGVQPQRIVVGGFSQGGAVALMMMRSKIKLAGVIGLSTYLPLRNEPPVISEQNAATPVLLAHGEADPVVRYEFGKMTNDILKQAGGNVQFKTYRNMGHSACPEELEQVRKFLSDRLAGQQ